MRWVLLIVELVSHMVIGDIGFYGTIQDVAEGEIGFAILYGFRGHGYATEAATALVKWTFAQTEIERIIVRIEHGNNNSVRVAAKLRMQD